MVKFNSAEKAFEGCNGTEWVRLDNGSEAGSVLNVTTHVSSQRNALQQQGTTIRTLDEFIVDKKSPTSILVVSSNLSAFGREAASSQQMWTYGNGPTLVGQGTTFAGSTSSTVNVAGSMVISGHSQTGPQTLRLLYRSAPGNRPFQVYNPNGVDDPILFQTQSVFTVMEIEP